MKKRILVVEDDRVIAGAMRDYLKAYGYEAQAAYNGKEAMENWQQKDYDLMLVDVQLPLKNGIEICHEVRQDPRGAKTPVVLMSAVYRDVERARDYAMRGLRANAYMEKPFGLSELLNQVESLIGAA